jgi:hypothetical protein
MLVVFQNIIIYDGVSGVAKLQLPYFSAVEINTSRNNLTDTCTVSFPQKISQSGRRISDMIQVNDRVEVQYGYGKLTTEFVGYVTGIEPKYNCVVTLENDAWLYKKDTIGKDVILKNTTFDALIKEIYTGKYLTIKEKIGNWAISKDATLLDVLDELKQKFSLPCYWQNGILYVAYEFEKSAKTTIKCDVNANVLLGTDNITLSRSVDVGVVSQGTSPQKDGTTVNVYSYYKNGISKEIISTTQKPRSGSLNNFSLPGLTFKELKALTERRLPKLYSQSISGEITTYGEPSIQFGDAVSFFDRLNPDINGVYDIVEVVKTCSVTDGIRQVIKIGEKIANN